MKKILTLAILLSFGAMADEGGFKAGEAPPPPHKQDAGYKGSEDTAETKITQIRSLRDGAWVTLEGNIIKKTGGDTYDFQDKSGAINLTIPKSAWGGKKYDSKDLVRVSGFVKGKGKQTHVLVKQLGEP
ncbi:NirD/YgiW/YdeI family stress tolerance protein [Pantoea sp. MBD-2R]|uniref:YgiW/YdeI family stress tolerance OB fold protein n=1 Tax=unclassified Pantoea TaxID=2630326 RepID=UPI0011BE01A3|nr:NirD/YgiW/YdeI family stress tolerance protein [Pantoea sp. CCBC3-3-1]